jgi:pimeloyl-ACP methyl ester carboxylesterase
MTYGSLSIRRMVIRDGLGLAFIHAGAGGYPLLLIHGWPETKRIWSRNVDPLAAAGFEVIAPDLRGFGDSDLSSDGNYDVAAHARDLHALLHDVLKHDRCAVVAGDLGGAVLMDLALRYPGFVERACIFNTVTPLLPDAYAAAGLVEVPRAARLSTDYFIRQATDADALAAELDTPERRRRYVADFYGHRFWTVPGAFAADDVAFMTEPFADAARFRASIANYEYAGGSRTPSEPLRVSSGSRCPRSSFTDPHDHVIAPRFPTARGDRLSGARRTIHRARCGAFSPVGSGTGLKRRAALVFRRPQALKEVPRGYADGRNVLRVSQASDFEWHQVDRGVDPTGFVSYLDAIMGVDAVRAAKRHTFTLMKIRAGHAVLEVGCGAGDDLRSLAELVGPTGRGGRCDCSETMDHEARAYSWVPVECHIGDAHHLEFAADSFDSCRAERVLQHVVDPFQTLSELARVVRPGGRSSCPNPITRPWWWTQRTEPSLSVSLRLVLR